MKITHALALSLILGCGTTGVSVAQTVHINDGEILTEADLNAGEFNGQQFALGPNTTFEVNGGGIVDQLGDNANGVRRFDFQGSTLNINDGGRCESTLFVHTYMTNLKMNISEGGIVNSFANLENCHVVNTGGIFGSNANLGGDSSLTLISGSVGGTIGLYDGIPMTVSGGSVGINFGIGGGTVLTISGGTFRDIGLAANSTMNLHVRDLFIDGVEVQLVPGVPHIVLDRNSERLTCTLADGSFFDFNLHTHHEPNDDGLSVNTLLTATLVVDCIADVNGDGILSPSDFSAWVAAFNSNGPGCDQNYDGLCSPSDFSAWIANFTSGC